MYVVLVQGSGGECWFGIDRVLRMCDHGVSWVCWVVELYWWRLGVVSMCLFV